MYFIRRFAFNEAPAKNLSRKNPRRVSKEQFRMHYFYQNKVCKMFLTYVICLYTYICLLSMELIRRYLNVALLIS